MITVMELEAALKKARKSGVINGSDVLYCLSITGNLAIARRGQYIGKVDMRSGEVETWDVTIKGVTPQIMVIDEISAFLGEGGPV